MVYSITKSAGVKVKAFNTPKRANLAIISIFEITLRAFTFSFEWGWISVLGSIASRAILPITAGQTMCRTGYTLLFELNKFGFALAGLSIQYPVISIWAYIASLSNAGNATIVLVSTQLACILLNIVCIHALVACVSIGAGLTMIKARLTGKGDFIQVKAINAVGTLGGLDEARSAGSLAESADIVFGYKDEDLVWFADFAHDDMVI